jgi:hypothetical protein
MGFNNTAMQALASYATGTLLKYAQLHSAAAGVNGTANVTTAARVAPVWAAPTGAGSFGLASVINFTGGAANGAVYSVTLWSASSGGTFYGEFVLTGDVSFDASGNYTITALNETGAAS